jgi:adenylate kinase
MKRVIIITGTPCVGKTTVAKALAIRLGAEYINLTDFAKSNNLTLDEDVDRCTFPVDEDKMRDMLGVTIDSLKNSNIVVDGHYASVVAPAKLVSMVFVLRRNPKELKAFMEKRGYSGTKMWENLQAEIIDVCLGEAVEMHADRVCELDVTAKTTEVVVEDIIAVLEKCKTCRVGAIDWMGMLEAEGVLDQYLNL